MLSAVIFIFVVFLTYFLTQMRKPPNFPPGPTWWPFIGNQPHLTHLSKSLGGQHLALSYLAKKHKTDILGLKLGKEYVITVFNYPLVREIMIREEFEGRPDNFFFKMRCFGKRCGITSTDGTIWSTQRSFALRHFRSMGYGKSPMEMMVKTESAEIVTLLKSQPKNIALSKFLAPAILNILWSLVTGKRVTRGDLLNQLLDLFNTRVKLFDMTGGTLNQYPWLRFVAPSWSGYNLIQEINTKIKKMILEEVNQHYKAWKQGRNDDLIYCYLNEIHKAENTVFNEEELIVVCLDFFIAGTQITSATLEFIFLAMILYPDVQKKVQEQIDNNFDRSSEILYSDREKLPYIEAVLMEVERYYHVVPIEGPRRALKSVTLNGYTIPKDSTILISAYSVHHNSDYWKHPEIFNPERFLNEDGTVIKPQNFVPFGLGRRRCLGEVLAKQCLFFVFVEVMRNFNVKLSEKCKPLKGKFQPGITLSSEDFQADFEFRV